MANQLFCVVILNKYKKNVVVPVNWISRFNLADSVNESLNRHDNRLIFYAKDLSMEPKFDTEIAKSFDENVSACHWGKTVKCYSKFI